MESFFGIPGLGSFTIDAINAQDFAIVRTMVFVGTVLYVIGLILTESRRKKHSSESEHSEAPELTT